MRKCQASNCGYNVFSNNFCQRHQHLRQDQKYLLKKNKPSILKKKRTATTRPCKVVKQSELPALYREIISERPLISFLTGKPLGPFDLRNFTCCAHVLAKGQNKYPRFKSYKKNIVLLSQMEHHLFDNGTEQQRIDYAEKNKCSWQPLYDLRDELIEEYKNLPAL